MPFTNETDDTCSDCHLGCVWDGNSLLIKLRAAEQVVLHSRTSCSAKHPATGRHNGVVSVASLRFPQQLVRPLQPNV
jgi:hypothetical protein